VDQIFWQKIKGNLSASYAGNDQSSPAKWPWKVRASVLLLSGLLLSACSAVQMATDKVGEMTLSALGITVPEKPDVPLPPRLVTIQLDAAQDMNAGDDGKGLSVIFRLYKLKSQNAFLATPYSTFGNAEKEKEAMGDDILEAREYTLSPGQTIKIKEAVARESGYIGMVSLFRAPSPQRWRFAFVSADASSSGITIGLHRCAMTATSTPPIGMTLSESTLLSPTKCEPI
jgi:type VI secretion system protein VasD